MVFENLECSERFERHFANITCREAKANTPSRMFHQPLSSLYEFSGADVTEELVEFKFTFESLYVLSVLVTGTESRR